MAQKFDNVSDKELFADFKTKGSDSKELAQAKQDFNKGKKSLGEVDDIAIKEFENKQKAPKEDYKEDLDEDIFIKKDGDNYKLSSKYDTYGFSTFKSPEEAKSFYDTHKNDVRHSLISIPADEEEAKAPKNSLYLYAQDDITDEDIAKAKEYGLTFKGYNKFGDERNAVFSGSKEAFDNFNKEYLGDYEINPDYFYEDEDSFAGDISDTRYADLSELDEDLHDDYYALKEATGLDLDGAKTGYQDNVIETDDGEYLILTDEEADEYARRSVDELIDDLGLEAFNENFQDWIIDNALDQEWFKEAYEESNYYYIDDIENEAGNGFESRLVEEAYDEGIVSDDELEENEYGDKVLKDNSSANFERIKEDYLEYLNGREDDYVGWYRDNFGDDDLTRLIRDGYVDLDREKIIDEVIEQDGRAMQISSYDNKEIELPNGKFAYRIN